MATRTNKERYTQALSYINKNISGQLALDIQRQAGSRQEALGKAISLSSAGFWNTGSDAQHTAVRALLLCQQVYLQPPIGKGNWAGNGSETKTLVKNCTEYQIGNMIRSYTRTNGVTLQALAQTARDITSMAGDFNKLNRTRAEVSNWGGTTNCYGAVKVWLFKSGICSLQWMLNEGADLTAYTCNQIIGEGEIVREDRLHEVPEGWVFNIQDSRDENICHWGIILGNGLAAASNTTGGAMSAQNNELYVNFQSGNTGYGIFNLQSSVDVCKCTYSSKSVVVKVTNPLGRIGYY